MSHPTRSRAAALVLPLIGVTAAIYALSAALVPQLGTPGHPLTPDNQSYLALCRGHFTGIEEPFRFRVLAPWLASLAGDCTRGFILLDALCSATASVAIALTAARLTPVYLLQLLAGLIYLALFCPRAHEAPWLTDALASAGSAAAFGLTTARFGPIGRGVGAGLATLSGLGRELLPPLFLRMHSLILAARSRRLPPLLSYGPALAGIAIYVLATRLIGTQLGPLSTYVTDVLSDTAAKDDPLRYAAGMLGSMYFLWPYGLAWPLLLRPGSHTRRVLQQQALLVISVSLLQSLLGGDIGRLFRLFTLPVFAIAAVDVAANGTGPRGRLLLGATLASSSFALGAGLILLSAENFLALSQTLLGLNICALAPAVVFSRVSDTRHSARRLP